MSKHNSRPNNIKVQEVQWSKNLKFKFTNMHVLSNISFYQFSWLKVKLKYNLLSNYILEKFNKSQVMSSEINPWSKEIGSCTD